jgi:two-component system, cell cycle sensor histidine kinase and response regulator CckA
MSIIGLGESAQKRKEKTSEKSVSREGFLTVGPALGGVTPPVSSPEALRLARFALDQAADGVQWISPEGRFLYVNEEACRELGYSRQELLTMAVWDIDPDRTREVFQERFQMLKEQEAWTFETRHRRKDGTIFPVEIAARYGTFGGREYYFAFVRDITKRKRAEEALRVSEERWQFALEGAGEGGWDWNAQTNEVVFSRRWKEMLGFEEHEIGNSLEEWEKRVHPQDKERVYAEIEKHFSGQVPVYVSEHRVKCKDGTYKWILDRGKVITRTNDGKPLRVVGTHSDLTARKQAEEALRESEELFRSIVEHSHAGIYMIDDAFRFVYVNDLFCRITGYTREEIVGTDFRSILAEESVGLVCDHYLRRQRGEEIPDQYQITIVRKDGEKRIAEMTVSVITDAAGKKCTVGQGLDITERKRAEEALCNQYKFLEVLLESIPLPVFFKDKKETYLGCNKAFETLLGTPKSQIIGRAVHELTLGVPADMHHRGDLYVFAHPGNHAYEHDLVDSKMKRRHFVITKATYQDQEGDVAGLIGTVFETTEIKKLQAQLLQAQKMEAIGTLAAGVAHEINNPITGVMNYAQILSDQAEEVGADAAIPLRIIKEAERVSKIVKSLLSFARASGTEVGPVDIGPIIEDTLALTTAQFRKEGIQVLVDVRKGLPPIMANRQRIQQVVLNVVANCRYALNKKYGEFDKNKLIEIRAELIGSDGARMLRTTFHDRGTGIPWELQSEIFNPFFSTKPINEGTGLGLSISYGIVKDHQGNIQVESVEGEYTKMMVDLPVATHIREHATA